MRSGYVLLRSADGVGVKMRLHDAQRQSWTISIFLRRVPFRDIAVLPQRGQRSGRFSVCGTRADRGILPGINEMISAAYHKGLWPARGGSLRPAIPYPNGLGRMGTDGGEVTNTGR